MSVKAIRVALTRLAEMEDGSTPEVLRALTEVQAIERAATVLRDSTKAKEVIAAQALLFKIAEEAP